MLRGEKRRLIAAAGGARLLLLDEPTVGLDDDRGAACCQRFVLLTQVSRRRRFLPRSSRSSLWPTRCVDFVASYRVPDPSPMSYPGEKPTFLTVAPSLLFSLPLLAFRVSLLCIPPRGGCGTSAAVMAPVCQTRPLVRTVPVLRCGVLDWTTIHCTAGSLTDRLGQRRLVRVWGSSFLSCPGALASAVSAYFQ